MMYRIKKNCIINLSICIKNLSLTKEIRDFIRFDCRIGPRVVKQITPYDARTPNHHVCIKMLPRCYMNTACRTSVNIWPNSDANMVKQKQK